MVIMVAINSAISDRGHRSGVGESMLLRDGVHSSYGDFDATG